MRIWLFKEKERLNRRKYRIKYKQVEIILSVICGALIAKKISVRKVTLIGALVFIG